MNSNDGVARVEKLKAFGEAYIELVLTTEAILMIQRVRKEIPEEFGDDAQLGEFVTSLRKTKEAIDELAQSATWNSKQAMSHNKIRQGCEDWIGFFHNHSLLGGFMTLDEVVKILGVRATELGKIAVTLATELGILL